MHFRQGSLSMTGLPEYMDLSSACGIGVLLITEKGMIRAAGSTAFLFLPSLPRSEVNQRSRPALPYISENTENRYKK